MSYIGNSPTQGAITGGNIVDGSIESIDLATLTNIDINSGSIDGTIIGASSAAAGTFTGLTVGGTGTGDANIQLKRSSDGLTVGNVTVDSADSALNYSTAYSFADFYTESSKIGLRINNGDVLFYEDTGSSVKMLWDASEEQLSITGSVSGKVPFRTYSGGYTADYNSYSAEEGFQVMSYQSDGGSPYTKTSDLIANADGTAPSEMRLLTKANGASNPTEAMRISSAGNVGIGTSSPNSKLSIVGGLNINNGSDAQFTVNTSGTGDTEFLTNNGLGTDGTYGQYIFKSRRGSNPTLERMRIDSNGNVGIGTNVPRGTLSLGSSVTGSVVNKSLHFGYTTSDNYGWKIEHSQNPSSVAAGDFKFMRGTTTSWAESARFDNNGNLLVGKTSPAFGTQGIALRPSDGASFTRANASVIDVNRLSTDGEILGFYKDGATVGSITSRSNFLQIGKGDIGLEFHDSDNTIYPAHITNNTLTDNTANLGSSFFRFSNIYAANGTINTSDRNEKQDIKVLNEAEQRVAQACKGLLRKFRWKDSVAEKGDDARIHFGIIAQDLQDAFTAEGLDAGRYAMFISTTWTDEETGEERTRLGVRYSELLAFIIATL